MMLPYAISNHEFLSGVKSLIWLLFRHWEFDDPAIKLDSNWLDKINWEKFYNEVKINVKNSNKFQIEYSISDGNFENSLIQNPQSLKSGKWGREIDSQSDN